MRQAPSPNRLPLISPALVGAFLAALFLLGPLPPVAATDEPSQTTVPGGTVPTGPPQCGEYQGVVCQGWFTDDADVVDDDQRVEDAVDRLVGRHGNQIAVVVVEGTLGDDPLTFAQELGNAWGIGAAERQDGIVVLVDLESRRTEITTGPGVSIPESSVAGAGDSFFGSGDFEGGLLAIVGSLEQELAAAGGDGEAPAEDPAEDPAESSGDSGGGARIDFGLVLLVAGAIGIGLVVRKRRATHRSEVEAERQARVDTELGRLEPAGHELPRIEEYALPRPDVASDVPTGRLLDALAAVDDGRPPGDDEAVRSAWAAGLLAVVDRNRLVAESEVPLELRASQERPLLEGAVQQAAHDALAVGTGDDDEFTVRLQELGTVVATLRPHRIAAARERAATTIVNRLATTGAGEAAVTDTGRRILDAAVALDRAAPAAVTVTEVAAVHETAAMKTGRLESLYAQLPADTTRPAVAAALADLVDEPEAAVARYEKVRLALTAAGDALAADGIAIPALAALLLMNNDDDDIDEFVAAYQENRTSGFPPGEAVEYALAGLRTAKEIDHVRAESRRLDLPVAITAALLRRRDDGPEVYAGLAADLAGQGVEGDTAKTIAGLLAISLEPAQAMRRWVAAREALGALGLKGAYADVAAAFGASDPRGPRVFALAYAAQRRALSASSIEDADRFAPELAHEGTRHGEDTWSGEPIPRGLTSFDPFTLLFYHWVITRGHHGTFGWESIDRDTSWSDDRGSWWGGSGGFGGWGGGGGFSGGGGSSWDSGSWGGGGGFGGFGGGGGFSGGGGSSW